jgi:hypothetical protein
MSYLQPQNTTMGDICRASLKECGAVGVGQTPLAEDVNDAWARLQWMLMQWERKRWLLYHLVSLSVLSTGAQYYTVGPGGDFDTGQGSMRPGRLSSCFVRQQGSYTNPDSVWDAKQAQVPLEPGYSTWDGGQTVWDDGGVQFNNNAIDYWLEILESKEDYNRITLKGLRAGPGEAAFLDTDWPQALLYVWPIPQSGIYEIHASFYMQLQVQFLNPATQLEVPWEYYNAMMLNLAIRLRPKYRMGTYPGDALPGMAKDSLAVLRAGNTQVARLRMPNAIRRRGQYNIFSDRPY